MKKHDPPGLFLHPWREGDAKSQTPSGQQKQWVQEGHSQYGAASPHEANRVDDDHQDAQDRHENEGTHPPLLLQDQSFQQRSGVEDRGPRDGEPQGQKREEPKTSSQGRAPDISAGWHLHRVDIELPAVVEFGLNLAIG